MADLADLITVCVVTSPTASDPSIETLWQTLGSVKQFDGLNDVRVLIGADGVRPEQRDLADAYAEKIARIRKFRAVIQLRWWGHQANVIRLMLQEVHTPLLLFMEGDTPLTPDVSIDWAGCAEAILSGELHLIRFLHESRVLPEHEHLALGGHVSAAGVPYIRTAQWSQRPHLADTAWYRDLIDRYFSESSRCFVEDVMHSIVVNTWHALGQAGLDRYKMGIYADPEPTLQRSYHLDGRAGGDKYEQVFAFPDMGWPEYAPCPSLQRVFE